MFPRVIKNYYPVIANTLTYGLYYGIKSYTDSF